MVLSQAFAFIDQPFVNRLKAWLHLAEVLRSIELFCTEVLPHFRAASVPAGR